MKKLGFLIFWGALVVGFIAANASSISDISDKPLNLSFNFGSVKGSGNPATESREVRNFKAIEVSSTFQVEITAQKDFSVTVEADDNILPLIETEVRHGVLNIECSRRVSPKTPMKIIITAPDIEEIDSSGASNVILNSIKNAALNIDSSGASKILVTGETAKLVIDVSGSTIIDTEGLLSESANVETSGASQVSVNVINSLRTDASGASKITYSGNPRELVTKKSGAASVAPR
jgi:hypothetical protein